MTHKKKAGVGNCPPAMTSLLVALFVILVTSPQASADMPLLSKDGWHGWLVEAHSEAPDWCCFSWSGGVVRGQGCTLDTSERNYGSVSGSRAHPAQMQIYARMSGGKAVAVRSFGANCPVTPTAAITDHGHLDAADSVAWLRASIGDDADLSSNALAAIGVHEGNSARRALVATARSNSKLENRKYAVFWMGQTRGAETAEDIKALMFRDASAQMREHAAFALSQSNAAGRADALIRLATTDRNADVRAKAWFWLSQTRQPDSAAAMLAALETETHRQVLVELVFAISQLPENSSADTLISVIENRRLPEQLRERALFWLAQDATQRAEDYLGAVFDK